MSHIAFFSLPAAGHVYPTLAVVSELVSRGHRVTYLTTDAFADLVRAAGAEAVVYESRWNPEAEGDPAEAERKAAEFPLELVRQALAPVPAAEERFGADLPDLVVYDGHFAHVVRVLRRHWNRPGVQFWPTFATGKAFSLMEELAKDAPPPAPLPPGSLAEVMARMERYLADHGAAEIPLPELDPLESEGLYLVFLPREFQFDGEAFPDNFAFVGPCPRPTPGTWVPPTDNPVLLISMGTTGFATPDFFRDCAKAFADQPWHVVIATGTHIDPATLAPLPPNVEAHQQIPQLDILPHTRLFITHGGMGSTMESLANGVPLVFTPHTPEQRAIARRATDLGLGHTLAPEGITATALRDLVNKTDENETIRRRTRRMREAIERAGGTTTAADQVEAFLTSHR
ncbi:macrolide family glycosyltransferase [Actinokineospora pegani]|uniref:macrolide family glycosyltransferase n=1 Tax=Actinokineospora pegani TaxID=2654637 RepID=UPI0012E9E4EC|nr:macrolide family glycosyltransferase [Actinokineospora pegani]